MRKYIRILLLCCWSTVLLAGLTPVGLWESMSQDDLSPTLIQVYIKHGQYFGKIVRLPRKSGRPTERLCIHCHGDRYQKPLLGMVILRGLQQVADKQYEKGYILDPRNGKDYRCQLTLSNNGQQLKVHGYIGLPIFGKTVYWQRATL